MREEWMGDMDGRREIWMEGGDMDGRRYIWMKGERYGWKEEDMDGRRKIWMEEGR